MKKLLSFIIIVAMFLLVASVETVETTSQSDIASAKIQAQLNIASKGVN